MNRKQQTMMNRIKIGHSKLTHSYIIKKEMAPQCDQCKTKLTINHIILECKKYEAIRHKNQIPSNMETIFQNTININRLNKFIHEIKLNDQI